MGMGTDFDMSLVVLQLEKMMANGIPTLDENAKIPKTQIDLDASDVGAIGDSSFTAGLTTNDTVLSAVNAATGTISTDKLPDLSWNKITTDIPTPITVLRNNQTPPDWSYWLFGNFYGQYWELMQAAMSSVASTIALRTSNGSLFGSKLVANGGTPSTSTTTGDSVISGGQGIGGNQHIGGFSSLGGTPSGHPAIKMKTFKGIMPETASSSVTVSLDGILCSKITSIITIVDYSVGGLSTWICSGNKSGFQFNVFVDSSGTSLKVETTDSSSSILSKIFITTVFYRE